MTRLALLALAAAALIAAGCGDEDANGNGSASSAETANGTEAAMKSEDKMAADDAMKSDTAMRAGNGRLVKVVDSDYGPVIADGKGEALYLFDKEETKRSECFGECATAWPPVLTKGAPRAGTGAKAKLLGTTKRPNGKLQVTYAGHPLYYYVDDSPGTILCHDVAEFGGLWLVVKPNGAAAPS